ncbi:MAG: LLM class flavin-dependent oxidoreductase [Aliifodinibius sp.]|nr:LLM class flavin-dependent oxidoreductase [Fodinibius sp.]
MNSGKLSIAFQTNKTASEYIQLAKLVNQYDFEMVSVYCDAPFHPSFGPLLLMAPYLYKAVLGPAAVSPFRIHPIDIAANTALLSTLAENGIYLGLARGAWLSEHGVREPTSPLAGIREAVFVIQKLLNGESAGLNGKVFQIKNHVSAPYPLPEKKIPLMIGTWGEKLAEIAGEIADEVKIGGSANPKMVAHLQKFIHQGELRAGKLKGEVGIVMGAVTVVDEDRALARKIAKQEMALYLPVVARLDPTIEIDPELLNRVEEEVRQQNQIRAAELIPDKVLDQFAFAGSPNDLIRRVIDLFEAGASRVEFGTPHGINQEIGIRLLGEKVLPGIYSER